MYNCAVKNEVTSYPRADISDEAPMLSEIYFNNSCLKKVISNIGEV